MYAPAPSDYRTTASRIGSNARATVDRTATLTIRQSNALGTQSKPVTKTVNPAQMKQMLTQSNFTIAQQQECKEQTRQSITKASYPRPAPSRVTHTAGVASNHSEPTDTIKATQHHDIFPRSNTIEHSKHYATTTASNYPQKQLSSADRATQMLTMITSDGNKQTRQTAPVKQILSAQWALSGSAERSYETTTKAAYDRSSTQSQAAATSSRPTVQRQQSAWASSGLRAGVPAQQKVGYDIISGKWHLPNGLLFTCQQRLNVEACWMSSLLMASTRLVLLVCSA